MDTKRARKLLGKKGKELTDEQILDCTRRLEALADIVIDNFLALSPEERAKYSKKKSHSTKKSVKTPHSKP